MLLLHSNGYTNIVNEECVIMCDNLRDLYDYSHNMMDLETPTVVDILLVNCMIVLKVIRGLELLVCVGILPYL